MNSDSGYSKIYLKQIDLAINPKISATEKLRNPEIFPPFCFTDTSRNVGLRIKKPRRFYLTEFRT